MKHSYIIAFWSPFPITTADFCMEYFTSFFHRYGNVQCLFCSNDHEKQTTQLLLHADLMVVIFHQNYHELCTWLSDRIYRFANCMYMIIDYFPEKEFNLIRIAQDFRIPPSRLTCIPYNVEYQESIRRGDSLHYLQACRGRGIGQAGMDFHKELRHAAWMMLRALEK